MRISDWASRKFFNWVHHNHLIYNSCWEDPRIDRVALDLSSESEIMMITSAGCNALDYALAGPKKIHAVDMNPRQNALLELKMAGIRALEFDTFFSLFGAGKNPEFPMLYRRWLRPQLSAASQKIWDQSTHVFSGSWRYPTFYAFGTSGFFSLFIQAYMRATKTWQPAVEAFELSDVREQKDFYLTQIKPAFWNKYFHKAVNTDLAMAFLGVPRAQRKHLEDNYGYTIATFIERALDRVFCDLPLKDNYFWWLYLTGSYTRERCPEYLKEENFYKLKSGLVDRIETHTSTILDFLEPHQGDISHFVLLDHMDWLSRHMKPVLHQQWQSLVEKSRPRARFLWRSGGPVVDFVDPIEVNLRGKRTRLAEVLDYKKDLADHLHPQDRVQTYGSFYIANKAA